MATLQQRDRISSLRIGHQHGGGVPPPGLPRPWVGCAFATGPRAAEDPPSPACFGVAERERIRTTRDGHGTVPTEYSVGTVSHNIVSDIPTEYCCGHGDLWSLPCLLQEAPQVEASRREGDCPGADSARLSPLAALAPVGSEGSRDPYRRPLLWPTVVIFNGYQKVSVRSNLSSNSRYHRACLPRCGGNHSDHSRDVSRKCH